MAIKPVHRLTGDHIAFPTATDGVPIGSTPDKGVDGPLCENGQVRWLHANALAKILGGGAVIGNMLIVMLVLALLLIVMTSMMGSSRTLYQASVDGWFPRYLSRVNSHGAPTAAMWTDLVFNLVLLLASDYFAVLMISNVCYFVFNFLNLQSGWIHRIDRSDWNRPYRCPTWLLATGAVFGFVNMVWMGAGADVWGEGTLRNGLLAVLLIIPVFAYRHYVQDKGQFPISDGDGEGGVVQQAVQPKAGALPYLALIVAAAMVGLSAYLAA